MPSVSPVRRGVWSFASDTTGATSGCVVSVLVPFAVRRAGGGPTQVARHVK